VEGKVQEFVLGNQIKRVDIPLVAPWQFRLGLDGKWDNFYFSTRLQVVGKQRVNGYINATDPDKRQTISGYTLLNASAGYTVKDKITFFITIQNALDQRYQNPLPANLNDVNAPAFTASYQDPLRAMLGVRLALEK
jgi:outer membrane receptor protein involved in Fe transport